MWVVRETIILVLPTYQPTKHWYIIMKGFYRIFNNLWFIPLDKLLSFEIHVLFYLKVEVFDIIHIQLVWDILEHFGGHSPRLVQGLNEEEEVFNLFQNVPTSNFFSLVPSIETKRSWPYDYICETPYTWTYSKRRC